MEFTEQERNELYWNDTVKTLPNGYMMLLKDINKALNNESFVYFRELNTKAVEAVQFTQEEVQHYISTFYHCEDFGLPNGRGWNDELPWLIHFLSKFKIVKEQIKTYYMR